MKVIQIRDLNLPLNTIDFFEVFMKTITLRAIDIGHFDSGKRYYISEEYRTDSSRYIRSPSRHWPYSEYKHIFTKKYAKQLAEKLQVDEVIIHSH